MTVTPKKLTPADFARLDNELEAVLSDATKKLGEKMKEQYGEDLSGYVPEWERLGLDDTTKKTYKVPVTLIVELTEKEVWDITDGESDLVSNLMCVEGVEESFVFTPEELK